MWGVYRRWRVSGEIESKVKIEKKPGKNWLKMDNNQNTNQEVLWNHLNLNLVLISLTIFPTFGEKRLIKTMMVSWVFK